MSVFLVLVGIAGLGIGSLFFLGASGAIQEAVAGTIVLTGAVFFVGGCIHDAVARANTKLIQQTNALLLEIKKEQFAISERANAWAKRSDHFLERLASTVPPAPTVEETVAAVSADTDTQDSATVE